MSQTFEVTVSRTASFGYKTYAVEAENQAQAERLACEEACDDSWMECRSHYEVESIDPDLTPLAEPEIDAVAILLNALKRIEAGAKPVTRQQGSLSDQDMAAIARGAIAQVEHRDPLV